MSAFQRRKGAGFEREVANYLTDNLGFVVRRQLGQARDGGDDIRIHRYRIECKRRQSIAVMSWLEQCKAACSLATDVPIVVARADGEEAIAILRLEDLVPMIRESLP